MSDDQANGNSSSLPCSTSVEAAKLLRDVIGRDIDRNRLVGMHQDQINDLWRVVDFVESNTGGGNSESKGDKHD